MSHWPNHYDYLKQNIELYIIPKTKDKTLLLSQLSTEIEKQCELNTTINVLVYPEQTTSIENKTDLNEDVASVLLPYVLDSMEANKENPFKEYHITGTIMCCYYISGIQTDTNGQLYHEKINVILCDEDSQIETRKENNIIINENKMECDAENCAYNCKGQCMYKHVFGENCQISDKYDTGCSGFIPKNWRDLM